MQKLADPELASQRRTRKLQRRGEGPEEEARGAQAPAQHGLGSQESQRQAREVLSGQAAVCA